MKVLIYVLSWGMHLPLFWEQFHIKQCQPPDKCYFINCHLKALVFLYAFEESVDWHLLSSFCHDSNLHISLFKYELSTMGVSKESISKFLIGNWFHVKLRILSPHSNRIKTYVNCTSHQYFSKKCLQGALLPKPDFFCPSKKCLLGAFLPCKHFFNMLSSALCASFVQWRIQIWLKYWWEVQLK